MALVACLLALAAAAADESPARAGTRNAGARYVQGTIVKRHTEIFSLFDDHLTTANVAYPDALKFADATYAGTIKIIGANPMVGGRRPDLGLVKVLSKQSTEGGSTLRVRIRNDNPHGTLAARAVVTAITREPRPGG
jgi:hypothetical protein